MVKLIAGIMFLILFIVADQYKLYGIILSIAVIGDCVFDMKIYNILKNRNDRTTNN